MGRVEESHQMEILDEVTEQGCEPPVPSRCRSIWFRHRFKSRYLGWARISLNPVVTSFSLLIILAFVVFSICQPEVANDEFGSWQSWIGKHFTWLYIGALDVWALFIFYILASKYSSIKLGAADSVPEYNDATWFTMLFSCGVSTGLFFFGVAEPILHYTGKNRYQADSTMPDNRLAQEAMNLTLYHWGLHGWVVYTVFGLLLSLMAHRQGLPLTIKSCFYPLIGDKIFGWPGDLVDTLSVIATLFGVCTSLGLGTIQLNQGLSMLSPAVSVNIKTQVITIWLITGIATVSVVTGVKYGVRRLSEFCFTCGLVLMCCILLLDQTVYLLNLYTQSVGFYFQWLIQLGTHTDAFEQLGPSAGAAERGRLLSSSSADGPESWMNSWTIFYWGWWIAWCPFVGMFIAKISYGRTIKEFIMGTMAAPTVYVFMWMIIFGGAGLRMEREAAGSDICCHNVNMSHLLEATRAGPPEQLITFSADLCMGGDCSACSVRLLTGKLAPPGLSLGDLNAEILFVGAGEWGFTTPSRNLTRLSCRKVEQMWFDLMMSYGGLGPFLSGFSLVSLVLYFVTSMDSGSLVIDTLASNGISETPILQRIFWAAIEGLAATALLVAGGNRALSALQAVSIATGIVYLFLIGLACLALYRALSSVYTEEEEGQVKAPAFKIGLLDLLLADPLQEMLTESGWKRTRYHLSLLPWLILNILTAPYSVARTSGKLGRGQSFVPYLVSLAILLSLVIVFHALNTVVAGCWSLAWIAYIGFGFLVAVVRKETRAHFGIPGYFLEDLCLSLVLYPGVALQMSLTVEDEEEEDREDREERIKKRPEVDKEANLSNGELNASFEGKVLEEEATS